MFTPERLACYPRLPCMKINYYVLFLSRPYRMYLIVEAIVRSLSWRKHFIHNDNWYIITVYAVNILSFNVFFFFL